MEHPYILDKLKQRMKQLGFDNYSYDTVIVDSDADFNVVIDSSNQYHFLVAKVVNSDLQIVSDTGVQTKAESAIYSNNTFHNYREFTGQIFISDTAAFSLEFIRVSPTQ